MEKAGKDYELRQGEDIESESRYATTIQLYSHDHQPVGDIPEYQAVAGKTQGCIASNRPGKGENHQERWDCT